MRQIGTLPGQAEASRFTAYLLTQGISAHAEVDGDDWVIWVRDENKISDAKEVLESFRSNPNDPQYRDAVREAERIIVEEAKKRELASKNVIQMRGKWKTGVAGGRRPLVMTMIVLSIIVYLASNGGNNMRGVAARTFLFVDPVHLVQEDWNPNQSTDRLVDILNGQVWRVVTPIFIHFGTMHIVFNMFMFFQLGSLIEQRRGTASLGLLVFASATISNIAQGVVPLEWGGAIIFGGMSGVLYGAFGYLWMKTLFEPELGLILNQSTIVILLAWMLLGMSGALEQFFGLSVANWAHGVGLVVGVAIGYFPTLRKSFRGR